MFTKYTDIDLPKNYSGSRFKQAIADTKMKTHRAQDISPSVPTVKTAMSPSFQDIIDKRANEADIIEPIEQNDVNSAIEAEQDTSNTEPKTDLPTDGKPKDEEGASSDVFSLFKASGLGRLLDNKSKDDFLLIALIALLASDGSGDNLDAIVLLALLLLYS